MAHFTVCAKGCCKGRLAGFLFEQTWVTMVCIVQCIFRCKERKLEMLLMITQPIRCTRFVPPTTRQDSRVPNFIGPKLTRRYIVRLSTLRPATVLVCFIPDCVQPAAEETRDHIRVNHARWAALHKVGAQDRDLQTLMADEHESFLKTTN